MRNPLTLPAGCRSDLPPVSGLGTSHSKKKIVQDLALDGLDS